MKPKTAIFSVGAAAFLLLAASPAPRRVGPPGRLPHEPSEGALVTVDPYSRNTGAACPLQRTEVRAEISGFLARVRVRQVFLNNHPEKIEALYLFPLPAAPPWTT